MRIRRLGARKWWRGRENTSAHRRAGRDVIGSEVRKARVIPETRYVRQKDRPRLQPVMPGAFRVYGRAVFFERGVREIGKERLY